MAENKAAGEMKAPRRRNILTGFFPSLPSGISIYTGIDPSAEIGPVPGLSSINSLSHRTDPLSRTNITSGRLFVSGINSASGKGLSDTSTSPEMSHTAGADESTVTNTSTLISGNDIPQRATVTPDVDRSLETTVLSRTSLTAKDRVESEDGTSLNSQSSMESLLHGINTSNVFPSVISKYSADTHVSGPASLTESYQVSGVLPPFGYRLYSTAGIKDKVGSSTPLYNSRVEINSGISQSEGSTQSDLSAGAESELRVSLSSLNKQSSGGSHLYRINPNSVSNGDSKTIFFPGTKKYIASDTVSSSEPTLDSTYHPSSGASYIPYIDRYIGSTHSFRTGVNSKIDADRREVTSPQPFANQIDRPIFIPILQKIPVTGDRPAAFPQAVAVPLSQVVPLASPPPVPVATNVPAPLPVPVIKTILVPLGTASIGKFLLKSIKNDGKMSKSINKTLNICRWTKFRSLFWF